MVQHRLSIASTTLDSPKMKRSLNMKVVVRLQSESDSNKVNDTERNNFSFRLAAISICCIMRYETAEISCTL